MRKLASLPPQHFKISLTFPTTSDSPAPPRTTLRRLRLLWRLSEDGGERTNTPARDERVASTVGRGSWCLPTPPWSFVIPLSPTAHPLPPLPPIVPAAGPILSPLAARRPDVSFIKPCRSRPSLVGVHNLVLTLLLSRLPPLPRIRTLCYPWVPVDESGYTPGSPLHRLLIH